MKKAAEIKESWMPDEPTDKEMVELLTEIRSGLKNEIEIKDMQYLLHYFWRSDIPIIDAIRRRIERKVSRERVREWAKRFYAFNQRRDYFGTPDSTGGIVCITETTEERLIAMLKELGWEVDNA